MRKYIKFLALALLAVLILWFLGRSLDWGEVWISLSKANIWLVLLATAIICFGYLLRSLRWKTLLAPITESSLRELFATTTVGFSAVFLFGRMGEVVRPLWLPMRDKRVRPSASLVTIGVERICDLVAIALVFSLNLLWLRAPSGREADIVLFQRAGILILSGTIFGIISLAVFQHFNQSVIAFVEKTLGKTPLPKRIPKSVSNILNHLAASLQILRDPKEMALTILWTVALWLSISIPTWIVIRGFGLPFTFADALFVMGAASLGSLVPTPGGGAGAFHAATAGALIFLNVSREDAAALSIVLHLVYFAPALIFGFYYFIHGDISWERLRSLVISEENETADESKSQPQELRMKNAELRNAESLGSS